MRACDSVKSFVMVTGCGSGTTSPATFHIVEIFETSSSYGFSVSVVSLERSDLSLMSISSGRGWKPPVRTI